MYRGGWLRVGLCALTLGMAMALEGPARVMAASSQDGGSEVETGVTDAGVESSDAAGALGGGSMDDVADAGSARLDPALEDGALFGDPRWTYSPPTFDQCFADPVIEHWVDGISPPEGTVCDVD